MHTHTYTTPSIPNYTTVRQDRHHAKVEGPITYIHHSISYIEKTQHIRTLAQVDRHTELQAFMIKTNYNKHITLINTCIPPEHSSGIPANYTWRLLGLNPLPNINLGEISMPKHRLVRPINHVQTQKGTEISTQLDQLYILNNTDIHLTSS